MRSLAIEKIDQTGVNSEKGLNDTKIHAGDVTITVGVV